MKKFFTLWFMLFCNLTPLDGRFVNTIVFCRKSEFCKYITSLHTQHSIYVRQFEFFGFTMKQITSIFCNFSFAGQFIRYLSLSRISTKIPTLDYIQWHIPSKKIHHRMTLIPNLTLQVHQVSMEYLQRVWHAVRGG